MERRPTRDISEESVLYGFPNDLPAKELSLISKPTFNSNLESALSVVVQGHCQFEQWFSIGTIFNEDMVALETEPNCIERRIPNDHKFMRAPVF